MTNTIAQFQISTEEDLHFQLKFLGLPLAGRTLKANIKHRSSGVVKTELTLANGGLVLAGADDLTAIFSKTGMSAWPTGEYQADIRDETGGSSLRIMAVRFVYDEPGKLVYGVRGNQATVTWGGNQAVVTAIGGVGPPGPANSLAIGTVTTGAAGSSAEATITGSAPDQTLNLTIPRGNTGDQGDAGTLTVGTVTTGAPGSSVVITNTGTASAAVLNITIPRGDVGATGDKGWSPVLAVVIDGVRRVLQVADWAGGQGAKPTAGQYLGASGLVSDIASAVDIRGAQGLSGSVTDGDKGDVVVSDSGTTWTLDAGAVSTSKLADDAVSFAKMQNVATARILGRATASSGDVEELTAAQAAALLPAVVGDSGSGGTKGLVPAPAAGDAAKVLSGAGTWIAAGGAFPRGHIYGLNLANNGSTPATHLDITAGECRSADNTRNIILASLLTKRIDQVWAVGSGNGGLDTGTVGNFTYHAHAIINTTSLVIDALVSLSAVAPTVPSGWATVHYLGPIIRAAGTIVPFTQTGNGRLRTWRWVTPGLDINDATLGATSKSYVLPQAPVGISALVFGNLLVFCATTPTYVYLRSLLDPDLTPAPNAAPLATISTTVNSTAASGQVSVITDTAATVAAKSTNASTTIRFSALGFTLEI